MKPILELPTRESPGYCRTCLFLRQGLYPITQTDLSTHHYTHVYTYQEDGQWGSDEDKERIQV